MVDQKQAPVSALPPGPALYQAGHDLPSRTPTFRYAFLSSQRTGSDYLCRRLCNVKDRFGLPSEYLNPRAIQMMGPRLLPDVAPGSKVALGRFMSALQQARTTSDGAFGIKVQPLQLMTLVGRKPKPVLDFFRSFDRIVLMTRHDKLGQAISGAIAAQTGKWFGDGEEPVLDATQRVALFPSIARNLARYVEEERLILDVGSSVQKPVMRINYESIERDGPAVFAELTDFLLAGERVEIEGAEDLPVPRKSSGEVAGRLREEFLRFIGGDAGASQAGSEKPR